MSYKKDSSLCLYFRYIFLLVKSATCKWYKYATFFFCTYKNQPVIEISSHLSMLLLAHSYFCKILPT